MSPADPEDRDDSAGYPADSAAVSAAFDDIVAGWRADGDVPDWPVDTLSGGRQRSTPIGPDPDLPVPSPGDHPAPPSEDQPAQPPGHRPLPPRAYAPLPPEDDHFVPPEPPPLPRIGRAAAVGMGLIAIGLTLLLVPGLLGIAESVGLTLGLLTVAGGLGWLVLGSWSSDTPPDHYDDDDGAVF
jgi:hypothetical protein